MDERVSSIGEAAARIEELERLRECENRQTAEQIARARKAEQERDSVRAELMRQLAAEHGQLELQKQLTENAKKLWLYDDRHEIVTQGALNALMAEHDKWRERARRAEAEREQLLERVKEDNAVCICGCSEGDHERYDDGESCANEEHECIRTCLAIRHLYVEMRKRAEKAERKAASLTSLIEAENHQ